MTPSPPVEMGRKPPKGGGGAKEGGVQGGAMGGGAGGSVGGGSNWGNLGWWGGGTGSRYLPLPSL